MVQLLARATPRANSVQVLRRGRRGAERSFHSRDGSDWLTALRRRRAADALGPDALAGLAAAAGGHEPQQLVGAGRSRSDCARAAKADEFGADGASPLAA